ncbi:hypothetical protein P171DRAFT_487331 [Karstenula rhodostoma CBS 690.94]|uniref:Uncharacterized protein n=1 Tax=Karstenula rhodostoma CBS 690.94 TaxID=1392251 RepID=A0A9P4UAB5_9PLEO|nr:hypothetical protein P171DRAFT_487331 [Karstenula rhodostoma CBS 690.94]
MSDTTREGSTASGSDRSAKESAHTSEEQGLKFAQAFALFQRCCKSLVQGLSLKYPTGIQLDGGYKIIDQRRSASVTVTLQGKRSSHGGRSTQGGYRDPTTPTTARIEVPIPNPSITVLLDYIKNNMYTQLEAGSTAAYMKTKRFQVDTHLTVFFEFCRED